MASYSNPDCRDGDGPASAPRPADGGYPVSPAERRSNYCPRCSSRSRVYATRGAVRYRKCLSCGANYRTQEVYQTDADACMRTLDTAVTLIQEIERAKSAPRDWRRATNGL